MAPVKFGIQQRLLERTTGVYVADAPLLPFMNEEAEELMHYGRTEGKTKALPGVESHEGEDVYSKAERQKRIEAKTTEYDEHAKTIIDDKGRPDAF